AKNINPLLIPGINSYLTYIDSQLNQSYSFDNFIEGEFNRVARRAGIDVAKNPGKNNPYNPLIVYGGSGLGKTHLAHAIGNEVKRIDPSINVLYVSTQTFINQFISHAKENSINVFINVYQSTDVLIIDDVQNFAKAEKSQEAFFTIFNHLHQSGKQLILTSDRAPKDLIDVQDRLLSRFKWGLMTDLQCPDYDSRITILSFKMKKEGLEIPEKVIQYLAYNISGSIRELEGAVISLLAQSSLNKKEIDMDLAKKVLKSIINTKFTEITIENIQKVVCDYLCIEEERLREKTRKREVVLARHITMYLSRNFTKSSLKMIGEHFGGRDHTTVIHACQVVKDCMDTDNNFKKQVQQLEDKVQIALH
ncbi:MAG: chromosomal replication initiator protein DnaA, partial [Chitinophagaceae bacterium]